MMGAEKTLVNVNKGQDAYSVIGNYILNHVTAIEDMIAVIQINGVIIKELYMVDVDADGYFYWKSDWWEGEEDVALLDFFPVSDAEAIPAADVITKTDMITLLEETEKDITKGVEASSTGMMIKAVFGVIKCKVNIM